MRKILPSKNPCVRHILAVSKCSIVASESVLLNIKQLRFLPLCNSTAYLLRCATNYEIFMVYILLIYLQPIRVHIQVQVYRLNRQYLFSVMAPNLYQKGVSLEQ